MAVAFDAGSESHTGTTGSTSEASFGWTHTPVGTPNGVLVFVFTNANADYITSVDYGASAMTEVVGGEAIDTATEAGRCTTFFLGSSVPTGAQTVTVTRTNNATEMYAVACTVTAGAATSVTGIVLLQENQTLAEQAVDDGSPGTNSLRFAGINSGLGTPPNTGANSTAVASIAFAARSCAVVRETTAGQGSRSVGFSAGAADDVAAVHLAVKETSSGTNAAAENAAATGTANSATAKAATGSQAASATGTSQDATAKVSPTSENASATGTAYDATVTTGAATNASAECATATGTANAPSGSVAPSSENAAAAGTANAPSGSLQVGAGAATGTGASQDGGISLAAAAQLASATGTSLDTVAAIAAQIEAALATATAYDATVTTPTADPNPKTVTVHDSGHTVTIHDSGHTVTAREH